MASTELRITADWREAARNGAEPGDWQSLSLLLKGEAPDGIVERFTAWLGRLLIRLGALVLGGAFVLELTS